MYSDTWAGWLGSRIGVEDHVMCDVWYGVVWLGTRIGVGDHVMCDSMHNLVTFSVLFVNHTRHTSVFAKLLTMRMSFIEIYERYN